MFGVKDHSVRVWDAASGALLTALQGHSNTIRFITVSSDGRLAASGSDDRTICLWDLTVTVAGSKDIILICTPCFLYELSKSG